MNRILSWFFPVRLPRMHHVTVREANPVDEIPEAGIGVPKKKRYRDGIERFLAEQLAIRKQLDPCAVNITVMELEERRQALAERADRAAATTCSDCANAMFGQCDRHRIKI